MNSDIRKNIKKIEALDAAQKAQELKEEQQIKTPGEKETAKKQLKEHMAVVYTLVHRWWSSKDYKEKRSQDLNKAKREIYQEFAEFAERYEKLFRLIIREVPDPIMLRTYYTSRLETIEKGFNRKEGLQAFAPLNARRYLKPFLQNDVKPLNEL